MLRPPWSSLEETPQDRHPVPSEFMSLQPNVYFYRQTAQDTLRSSREGRIKHDGWNEPLWASLTGH